jgi:hypothetical protein
MFRFVGFVAGILIIFSLEYWSGIGWYIAIPLGILGYLIVRYAEYFVGERRSIRETMDVAKRDQISN